MKSPLISIPHHAVRSAVFGHPSGAIHLPAMALHMRVQDAVAGNGSILAAGCNGPSIGVLKMLSDSALDNYNMVADILGKKLTDEILIFVKNNEL